jgi:hypothetical protein
VHTGLPKFSRRLLGSSRVGLLCGAVDDRWPRRVADHLTLCSRKPRNELMPVPYLPDLIGVVVGAMVATIVVTPILSLLVLWRYRHAVRRSMHLTAPGGSQAAIQPQWQPPIATQSSEVQNYPYPRPAGPSAPVVGITAGRPPSASDDDRAGWEAVWTRLHSLCFVYVAPGVAYGLVAAIVWLQAGQIEFAARGEPTSTHTSGRATRCCWCRNGGSWPRSGVRYFSCTQASGGRWHSGLPTWPSG